MPRFRIALAQLESRVGGEAYDPRPDNLSRAEHAVAEAVALGAELVVFGEMYLTGFRTEEWNTTYALRLDDQDETLSVLTNLAATYDVQLIMGAATLCSDTTRVRNTALLVGTSGVLGTYDKVHVAVRTDPDGTRHDEGRWFSAGSTIPVWPTERYGVLGPQICYDNHFPEGVRVQTVKGADVLLNISASAAGYEQVWNHLRAARAIENAAWFINCSVVGVQKDSRFFGRSAVIDPFGNVVVEARDGVEDLVIADIDTQIAADARRFRHTLGSRRPDTYFEMIRSNDNEVFDDVQRYQL